MRGPNTAVALGHLRRHWPLLPVLALALFLRLKDLRPVSFYGDDAEYAIVASYLASNPFDLTYPRLSGFTEGPFVSQPPLVLYLFGLAFFLFGHADVAAVGVSVILGTITVGLVYALGVLWRDRATGFVAASFLAVMPFHVALSRKAFLDAGLVCFMTLAAVLLLHYLRAPSARRATLVGVGVGLAILAKLPGVLVGVVLLLYVGVEAAALLRLRSRGEPDARERLRLLPRHGLRAALVAAAFPLAWMLFVFARGGSEAFFEKMGFQIGRVTGDAADAGGSYQPWEWYLVDPQFGIPTLVNPTVYALAFVGVVLLLGAYVVSPVRARGNALVVLWIAVVLVFFSLADRKVWFYTLPITPAIALAAAYPIVVSWRALARLVARAAARSPGVARGLQRPAPRGLVSGALAGLLLLATAVPAWGAAEDALAREDHKFGEGVKEAALYIEAHGGGGQVGTLLGRFTIAFYHDAPTFHYFVDNGYGQEGRWVDHEIKAGRIRWLVWDDYLKLDHEAAWMQRLVDEHDGELVETWGNDWGKVRLYRFGPP